MVKVAFFVLVAVFSFTSASARAAEKDIDAVIKQFGGDVIRAIDSDICLPATAEEYEALGKNAILMLGSSTAIGTELPLRAVYAEYKGVRIPLHRIVTLDKTENTATSRFTQTSFYLLPIQLMKVDARIVADFKGGRKDFGVTSFSSKDGLDAGAPAFARLDEYDDPGDADNAVIAEVLAREYPDHFSQQ